MSKAPTLRVILTCVLAVVCWPMQASAQDATAAVTRYEHWRGGATYTRLRALHSTGSLAANGLSGTIEVWVTRSGMLRQDVDLGAFRQQTVITPAAGWATNLSGQVQRLSETDKAAAALDGAVLFDAVLRDTPATKLSGRPQERREGMMWDVVRVERPGAGYRDLLIAPTDGRLLGIRSVAGGRIRFTTYSDWREVDGVRVAFRGEAVGRCRQRLQHYDLYTSYRKSPDARRRVRTTRDATTGYVRQRQWVERLASFRVFRPKPDLYPGQGQRAAGLRAAR